jgi:hypothetical protein
MAQLVAQLVASNIAHQRLVRIRRVENPVGVAGKRKNRHGEGFAHAVHRFDGIGFLGIAQRRVAARLDFRLALEINRAGERGVLVCAGLDELKRYVCVCRGLNRLAEGVDDDERQRGIETDDVRIEESVGSSPCRWRSSCENAPSTPSW